MRVAVALDRNIVAAVQTKLAQLPAKVRSQLIARGTLAAAKVYAKDVSARLAAMSKTGTLRKSLKVVPSKRAGHAVVVDAKTGDKPGGSTGTGVPYAFLVEYGHGIGRASQLVKQLRKGRAGSARRREVLRKKIWEARLARADTRRRVAPRPFMRPAIASSRVAVHRAFLAAVRYSPSAVWRELVATVGTRKTEYD